VLLSPNQAMLYFQLNLFSKQFNLILNCLALAHLVASHHYPNPFNYPKHCGRGNFPSYICDPYHILLKEEGKLTIGHSLSFSFSLNFSFNSIIFNKLLGII